VPAPTPTLPVDTGEGEPRSGWEGAGIGFEFGSIAAYFGGRLTVITRQL
jgi:hypothetical protein